MADLIDKRDAVDEVARFRGYIDDDMIYRIQWAIRRLPVKHGALTITAGNKCSECGKTFVLTPHYCPYHGVKMDEEKEKSER